MRAAPASLIFVEASPHRRHLPRLGERVRPFVRTGSEAGQKHASAVSLALQPYLLSAPFYTDSFHSFQLHELFVFELENVGARPTMVFALRHTGACWEQNPGSGCSVRRTATEQMASVLREQTQDASLREVDLMKDQALLARLTGTPLFGYPVSSTLPRDMILLVSGIN